MDFLVLVLMTVCGMSGVPIHVVLIGALILTLLSARRKVALARAYPEVGTGRILGVALILSLANNTVFTLLSFGLGRVVALLA